MAFVLETSGRGPEISRAVREALARVDPDIPAADLLMLDDLLAETVTRPRAASLIGGLFAVIALLVAAAGIHGVLSYLVQGRTREIGIRSALGASAEQILGMVMRHSTRLLGAGLVLGTVGALASGRLLSASLFGVSPWDPLSLVGAAVLLGLVGSAAAWLPARRAVRVDPLKALRAE
jgi:ABC-type antimicrobial peptide transport system permease subunit